jgi:hypothetical protein
MEDCWCDRLKVPIWHSHNHLGRRGPHRPRCCAASSDTPLKALVPSRNSKRPTGIQGRGTHSRCIHIWHEHKESPHHRTLALRAGPELVLASHRQKDGLSCRAPRILRRLVCREVRCCHRCHRHRHCLTSQIDIPLNEKRQLSPLEYEAVHVSRIVRDCDK